MPTIIKGQPTSVEIREQLAATQTPRPVLRTAPLVNSRQGVNMSQRPSEWRVNDAGLYDALRDEARAALAGLLVSGGVHDASIAERIAQALSELYDVNGFDRDEVVAKLKAIHSAGIARD